MRTTRLKFAFAVLFFCLAKVALAAGMTSFVGVGVGNSAASVDGPAGQQTLSGAGYRFVAGNQVSHLVSFETEYVDFGQFTNGASRITAKGLGIAGVLAIPVSEMFSLYGRAGYARIETTSASIAGTTSPVTDMLAGLTLGYGLQIDLAPNASIRLAWDRYKSSTLTNTFTDRINMDSSGLLIFRF